MIRKLAAVLRSPEFELMLVSGVIVWGVGRLQKMIVDQQELLANLEDAVTARRGELHKLSAEIDSYPTPVDVDPLDRAAVVEP